MIEIDKYQKFIQKVKYIARNFEKLRTKRNEIKSYLSFYSLTKKEKKQFNNIENCYKYHQSKHKVNDKYVFCKRIS